MKTKYKQSSLDSGYIFWIYCNQVPVEDLQVKNWLLVGESNELDAPKNRRSTYSYSSTFYYCLFVGYDYRMYSDNH